jgi:RNA polymerase-interacting CarD/CdnL/TRCF family regulator
MNFASTESRRFYRMDFFNTTVWVPVDNQSRGGLRPIIPKGHLAQYRAVLKCPPVSLDSDFRKRRTELEKRMDKGGFQGLCEVIRDLDAFDVEKPLSYSEKNLLKQTREALVREWPTTSGVTDIEALREINGCLFKGRKVLHNV